MRVAIQSADLDSKRIDGTRVYLLQMLNRFGDLSPSDDFFIYHKSDFNPELTPRKFKNYQFISKNFPLYWTQSRFAVELWKGNFDCLWMPMQALPIVRKKNLKTTVTIHDLAFKYFPRLFPRKDLRRLNLLSDFAIRHSDKIIAVSNSTKKDILKFYPKIKEGKIKVIYHGFDPELFQKEILEEEKEKILKRYNLQATSYILYVGALQPRKNLELLIETFKKVKISHPDLKLVLAGGKAWMWGGIIEKSENSRYKKDIIITGTIPFNEIAILYRHASVFVFPSLYEGFGIPILEAFASKIPVVTANNSSLPEIGGDAVLYFNEKDQDDLADKMEIILQDDNLKNELIKKGEIQLQKFSWDKCAEETLKYIKS